MKVFAHIANGLLCGLADQVPGMVQTEYVEPEYQCRTCRTILDGAEVYWVERQALLESLAGQLLLALGEDPQRAGLKDTPRRWASAWTEFIEYDAGNTDVKFEVFRASNMVVIGPLRVWSMCEHHLLPFYCDLTIGYIPGSAVKDEPGWYNVLGLSKFGRIAQQVAHRLQIQEQLVAQVAEHVERASGSKDVAVFGVGEHLCMTMRGPRMETKMRTSVVKGAFQDATVRAEFMSIVNGKN